MIRTRATELVFAFLAAVLFWRVFFLGETLIATDWLENCPLWRAEPKPPANPWMSDTVEYYYPSEKLYSEAVRSGTLPLDNPHLFNGAPVPHGAHLWQSIWPVKLAFLLLLDPVRSYDFFAILHWWLAGVAMAAFLRSLDRTEYASLAGALAYALSGRAMLWLHGHYLMATLAYAPLVLLAVRRRSLWGIVPLAGIFFSNPQIALVLSLVALAWDRWSWRIAAPAALLAGVALVPLAAIVAGGVRDPGAEARHFYGDGFRAWLWLAGLAWPGAGLRSMPPNEYNVYLGLVPLAGAAIGLRRERFFAAVALGALALATLYPLPVWAAPVSFSLPTRYLFFFTLGMTVCFARALDLRPLPPWAAAGIVVLLLVDLVPRFAAHNRTYDPSILRERPAAVDVLRGRTGVVFADRGRPFFPPLQLFGVDSVQGYDVMVPRAQQAAIAGAGVVAGQRLIRLTDPEHPALEALGMRFLVTDGSCVPTRYREVFAGGGLRVYENPAAKEVASRKFPRTPVWIGAGFTLAGGALTAGIAFLERFRQRRYS